MSVLYGHEQMRLYLFSSSLSLLFLCCSSSFHYLTCRVYICPLSPLRRTPFHFSNCTELMGHFYFPTMKILVELHTKLATGRKDTRHPGVRRALQVSALYISTLMSKVVTMLIEGGIFVDYFILHGIANTIAELLHATGDPEYTGKIECQSS